MNRENQAEGRKFISDIVWIGLSQGLMSLTGLVSLPALTKGYPTEYYGLWAQMMVTVGLLSIILTLKLDSATIRFLSSKEDREERRRYLGALLWPVLTFVVFMIIIALLFRDGLSVLIFSGTQYSGFVPLVILWAALESLFLFFSSYLRARGRLKRLSVIRLVSALCRMAVIVVMAVAGLEFHLLVWGVIGVHAVIVTWLFFFMVIDAGLPRFNLEGLAGFMSYSTPQIPGMLLAWVIAASDRYFITHLLGIAETGVYSASYAIASLIDLLAWPVGMVLFPLVSRLWDRKEVARVKTYFRYSMKLFLMLAVPAVGGMFVLARPLLGLLATSEYVPPPLLILTLAAGAVFNGVVLINEYPVYLGNRTRFLPLASLTGAAVNLGINVLLIPRIGILGAAISSLVSFGLLSAIMFTWGRKIVSYDVDFTFIAKVLIAATAMTACLWFIDMDGVSGIITVAVSGVLMYIVFLFGLRAFSKEEISMVRQAITQFKAGLSGVA